MIEEPAKLTIRKPNRRPTKVQIESFKGIATGFVVDAMDGSGAMASIIKPAGDGRDLTCIASGPALTVDTGPADILALLASLKFIQPGDIVVSSFSGYQGCASCGDRVAGMMKNSQAQGFVSDGPIRDYEGIVGIGLPIWCTGINPNSPVGQGPGRIGLPISIGGVHVESGDMIVADRDGVVVVPFADISRVIDRLGRIQELEKQLDKEVEDGLTQPAAIAELLASDQVQYVE
ncbi:MAG: 4-hydroxy-4-methyl-2-oxoglutarate aldolase [Parasphingorhabdus sp.]|jgi:4-hydroxy-4-methyl-2-oxoglutarate aldolase